MSPYEVIVENDYNESKIQPGYEKYDSIGSVMLDGSGKLIKNKVGMFPVSDYDLSKITVYYLAISNEETWVEIQEKLYDEGFAPQLREYLEETAVQKQVSHLRKKVLSGWAFLFFENLSLLYSSLIQKKSLLKRQAGTSISLKDRRAAPALGSRLLRSYVPLRCGPNASGSARDMDVPAHASQINFSISS